MDGKTAISILHTNIGDWDQVVLCRSTSTSCIDIQALRLDDTTSTEQDVTASAPAMPHHRSLASVTSNVIMVGDDIDMHWDMDMMDGGMSSPKSLSLCHYCAPIV